MRAWLLLLVLAAPAAQAAMTVAVVVPDHPLVPDKESADLPVTVAVDCAPTSWSGRPI